MPACLNLEVWSQINEHPTHYTESKGYYINKDTYIRWQWQVGSRSIRRFEYVQYFYRIEPSKIKDFNIKLHSIYKYTKIKIC